MNMSMGDWLDTLPEDLLDLLAECSSDVISMFHGANPDQLRAATLVEGPVQINAVAGSGKTFVLTRRIAYMRYKGIKPQNIFCTTFTKKATGEMLERLGKLVPKMFLQQMTIGTTHSIGYGILKKEYKALNHHLSGAFAPGKDILMGSSHKFFVENVKKDMIKDMSIPYEVKAELNDIAAQQLMKAIGNSKNEGLDAEAYESKHGDSTSNKMLAYVEFYKRYEKSKWDKKLIDADDLLFLLWKLLKEEPEILAKYRRIYKYFLVDETQDNNDMQYDIITMLAYPENNIFVVGDDDQSMYKFRGAQPKNFIEFRKRFKDATMVNLEQNYRSNPGILLVANSLIAHNTERIKKTLRTSKQDEGEAVSYTHYKTEDDEAAGVVGEIKNLVQVEKFVDLYKGISILYRTNAQSRAFEDKLIMEGLPYVIHGGVSFYERKEVKDLVAYLSLIEDPEDFEAFSRIYNTPKRYLGKVFLEKISNYKGSAVDALRDPAFLNKLTYEKKGVEQLSTLLNNLRATAAAGGTPEELIDIVLTQGGYGQYLIEEAEESEDSTRTENVDTLKYVVTRYDDVKDFLAYIHMMTSSAKHDVNGVQLMTIHKSKGLEFPVAFVVGVSEGILPHFRAVEAVEEGKDVLAVEEERRLMYVAVTRPEARNYTSSIGSFNQRNCRPSRFIGEMKLGAVEEPEGRGPEDLSEEDKANRLGELFYKELTFLDQMALAGDDIGDK